MSNARSARAKPRVPRVIRWSARAAAVSLLIAVGALVAASALPTGWATVVLKAVFMASSAAGVLALLFWFLASGFWVAFRRDRTTTIKPSGDLW